MSHLTHTRPLLSRPLLCQELIGREQEFQELKTLLSCAATGQAQLCLISGEAGLGKTRLCRTFLHHCREQQATVLLGLAAPHDQMLPFGPFLDLFRRSLDTCLLTSTDCQEAFLDTFSFLLQFAPELTTLFPGLSPSGPDLMNMPARQRSLLFHQVLRGLQTLTRACQGPLIVVLEDLHWADDTSLELLAFLAHGLGINTPLAGTSTPLLILGTYRAEALPDNPALQHLISQLTAQRQVDILHLAPLDRSEHWQCINHILNQSVPEEFAQLLFTWDEGNPFFTEELLSAMLASGQIRLDADEWLLPQDAKPQLPSSLAAAILERLQSLSSHDQDVLMYGSIIGRRFDFSLLATLCHIDEHELVQILQRAIRLQLISVPVGRYTPIRASSGQERYRFRHALTREVIYEQMLLPERRLRHRTVAETIEKILTNSSSETASPLMNLENVPQMLVEHYSLASLVERAWPYALELAQRARKIGAFREERSYLDMVQASHPPESPERLPLLERMGIVSISMFEIPTALRWLSLARDGYLQNGQRSCALQTLAAMHFSAWLLADNAQHQMLAELESGVEAAFKQMNATKWDAHILTASSYLTLYQSTCGRYQRIFRLTKRNNTLFEAVTDPQKQTAILLNTIAYNWARANQHARFVEECIGELHTVFKVAHQQSLPNTLMFAYRALLLLLVGWGRIEEAERTAREAIVHEDLSDMLRSSFEIGWLYFFSGEQWEQGIERLGKHMEQMEQKGILGLLSIAKILLAHLLIARNELSRAEEHLSSARPILRHMNEDIYLLWMNWGFARLFTAQGKHAQAQECYEDTLACWRATDDTLFILPILLDGIAFYAPRGNIQQAKQWLAILQQITTATDNPVGKAALLEAQGILALQQKKLPAAIQALQQAVNAWGELKFRYHQALASHRLAEALLLQVARKTIDHKIRQQLREEAEALLQQTSLVYEQLGIAGGREALQRLREETRLDAQQKRRRTMEKQRLGEGLTRREMQILRLLASGKTNKEIADIAGISIGTVELHVTHILTKLNCENRTQAVLYAVSRGWIPMPY